ncbi:UTRA domain-containing protein [Nonomuraea phyllanthi]|uniref:UTRA domain-containing protein n=1 Tax=Nonomuraea phyllanthi TaxID=2219224 RepID=A0A5C4V611_9ACTN|nr:GntR family transcriptional regulator [Nonomuraea phyllanthi]KAB8186829.1 UTRA domain-containing protein [Nonomuraea phyllanthi]
MSPEAQTGPATQIANDLRAAIANGTLQPGAKLPTVRDLAEQYGVSRNTAAKAIAQLSNEGRIVTRYGSGAYVREAHPVRRVGQDRYAKSNWANSTVEVYRDERHEGEPAEQQGTQTQEVTLLSADERVAQALGVEVGADVYERDRIMFRDGKPTHLVTSYYRREDVEGTAIIDSRPGMAGSGGSFAILAERGLAPDEMTEELFARMPTVEEMVSLDLPPGEPVVEQWRTTRTAEGRVIEYAKGVHPASRFVWSYTFKIPD